MAKGDFYPMQRSNASKKANREAMAETKKHHRRAMPKKMRMPKQGMMEETTETAPDKEPD